MVSNKLPKRKGTLFTGYLKKTRLQRFQNIISGRKKIKPEKNVIQKNNQKGTKK